VYGWGEDEESGGSRDLIEPSRVRWKVEDAGLREGRQGRQRCMVMTELVGL